MTPNIASPIFNALLVFFFLVIAIGIAVGVFAALQLGKAQRRYEADEARLAMAVPTGDMGYMPVEAVTSPEPAPAREQMREPEQEPAPTEESTPE